MPRTQAKKSRSQPAATSTTRGTTARRSGRPPAKLAAARLDKILSIAAEIFLQEGFDRASVASIARLSGSSKETLYSRFSTKEDLFEAVIARKTEILLQKFSRVLVKKQPIEKVLELYGLNLLDFMLLPEMQRLNRTLIASAPQFPELAGKFWRLCPEREQEQLAGYLQSQVASGVLAPLESRTAAELFFSLCLGQFLLHAHLLVREPPQASERKRHIQGAVRMFLGAYRSKGRKLPG